MQQPSPTLPTPRASRWFQPDWLIVRDPGWAMAHMGWRTLLSLIVGMAAAYGVARGFGIPGILGPSAGALIAFISGVQVTDQPTKTLSIALAWFIPAFAIGQAGGIFLHSHRVPGLVVLVVLLALSVYLDRFGHYGHHFGTILFVSYLIGLLVPISYSVYPAVVLAAFAAAVAVVIVRALFCRYSPRNAIRQTRHALEIAARRVARSAAAVLDAQGGNPRSTKRLQQDLGALNALALTFDGRLTHPVVNVRLAEQIHQRMFDMEQILVTVSELCEALAAEPDSTIRAVVAAQLRALASGRPADTGAVRACAAALRAPEGQPAARSADLLELIADELDAYALADADADAPARDAGGRTFSSTISLEGARPTGMRALARKVRSGPAELWWRPKHMSATMRVTIQVAIGGAIALFLGYLIDPEHYYWAVIGVLIVGAPTNTPHERVRKVFKRAAGTVLGAILGLGIHYLIGTDHPWATITVIIVFLTLGAYFITSAYWVFALCLVTALVQLYGITVSSGALDIFLVHRLIENVLGGVVMLIVTLLVFPLSSRAVAAAGLHSSLEALARFLDNLAGHLSDPGAETRLRSDARAVDHALFQTRQVAAHLLRVPARTARSADAETLGRPGSYPARLGRVLDGLTAAAIHARRIARHAPQGVDEGRTAVATVVQEALQGTSASATTLAHTLGGRLAEPHMSRDAAVVDLLDRLPSGDVEIRPILVSIGAIDAQLAIVAKELEIGSLRPAG